MVCVWAVYSTIQTNDLKNVFFRLLSLAALALVGLAGALVSLRLTLGRPDSSVSRREADDCDNSLEIPYSGIPEACLQDACNCSSDGTVSVRRSLGRPSTEDIVGDLLAAGSDRPGLLVCGPPALVADVRTHLRKHPLRVRAAVYEEKFAL